MITNIAPEQRYYYDTYCTLNFASKSKKIVNKPVVRETVGVGKLKVEWKNEFVFVTKQNGRKTDQNSYNKHPRL